MHCPDCQTTLVASEQHGIEIDTCGCGGAWFDSGELERLRAGAGKKAWRLDLVLTAVWEGRCPRCGTLDLRSGAAGRVQLRVCDRCRGIWVPRPAREQPRDTADVEIATGLLTAGVQGGVSLLELLAMIFW